MDYKEKHGGPSKKKKTKDGSNSQPGRRKSSVDSDAPEDDEEDDDLDRSSGELDEQPQDSRKRFGRLCKDKKVEEEDSLGGDADDDMLDDKSPAPDIERELEQHLRREEAPAPSKKDAKKKKKAVEEEGGSSTQGSTHKGDKKAAKAEGKRDKKAKVVWLETKDKEKVEKGPINPKTTQIVINLNKNQIEENEKSVKS